MDLSTEEIPGKTEDESAKRYSRIKIRLSILDMAITFILISVLAFSGVSRTLAAALQPYADDEYLLFIMFLFVIGIAASILQLPLDFFSSYIIEHRFHLSNQNVFRWIIERLKSTAIGLVLGVPVALAFFYFLKAAGAMWWIYFSAMVFIIAVFLARIAPVVIFPLFYKFAPVKDDALSARLSRLLEAHNISFRGVYTFNMSKDTRKANAGFTGMGRSKRIILSDTLLENFTPDEISVIFAHEIGHYIKRHISKNIFLSGIVIFGSFFLCGWFYDSTLAAGGYIRIDDIAALPILFFYLSVFSLFLMPLTNLISRVYEREADLYALQLSGDREAFISGMEKLSRLNLSDRDPHPAVEFLFYSHPSIKKRIEFARQAQLQGPPTKSFPEK